MPKRVNVKMNVTICHPKYHLHQDKVHSVDAELAEYLIESNQAVAVDPPKAKPTDEVEEYIDEDEDEEGEE